MSAVYSSPSRVPLVEPVAGSCLAEELSRQSPLRQFRGLEIHSIHGDDCPRVMREIGRIREAVFRQVGAGRNLACDTDALDFGPHAYHQLIAWDPHRREIVATYRYQLGERAVKQGDQVLRTTMLFDYAPEFRVDWLAHGIELGRSVVNPQARRRSLGLYGLWSGLGALLAKHPETRCFFGNVSLYRGLDSRARECIAGYLEHFYGGGEAAWLRARPGVQYGPKAPPCAPQELAADPAGRIRQLRGLIEPFGEQVPPLLQSYLGLGTGVRFGQIAEDHDFGGALEVGLVVPVATIDEAVLARFMGPGAGMAGSSQR